MESENGSKMIGIRYVRTQISLKPKEKKKPVQKFPDTCGRRLSASFKKPVDLLEGVSEPVVHT